MKYRRFGKLDWKVSALGFGAMRLPVIGKDNSHIDEPKAMNMIRHAIDQGVNYLDTAYPYHMDKGEIFVGKALRDGYRDKIKLATKMPTWYIQSHDDFDRYLNEQLKRLQTDHIDFYLLHSMNKEFWPRLRDMGILKWAEKTISDGRIHHLGFSFHDTYDIFKQIVDAYDKWTLCQIQYNFMDIEYQAGTKGLKYAADKGMAVVVMEPLRGGQLTKKLPESIAELCKNAPTQRTMADRALQWVWNHPEVSMVLSGMSAMEHVTENLASAENARANSLGTDELSLIDRLREEYRKLTPVPCSNCKYCMPCPNGVNISRIFELYNDAVIYNEPNAPRFHYRLIPPEEQADRCTECLECGDLCPQDFSIPEWLEKAHQWLGPKK